MSASMKRNKSACLMHLAKPIVVVIKRSGTGPGPRDHKCCHAWLVNGDIVHLKT
ncbi:hypothetical protein O9992_26785 [Vibrio lentus]|nr:hypothetical protein [Vibrio lentus]